FLHLWIKRLMTFRRASWAEYWGPLRVRGLFWRSTNVSNMEQTKSRKGKVGDVFFGLFGYSASSNSARENNTESMLLCSSSTFSTSDIFLCKEFSEMIAPPNE